jgi:hypothetical protein
MRHAVAGHRQRAPGKVDEIALLQQVESRNAESGQMHVAGARLGQRDALGGR